MNMSGQITLQPCDGADVVVNGKACAAGKAVKISHNDRVRLGSFLTFRVVEPARVSPADEQYVYFTLGRHCCL
jgi:hypothetical protein